MNLAITTSGAKLSTNLPATVSPSRLLQASTFLTSGDTQYSMSQSQSQAVQIGPTFTLSMYMLFAGHLRPHDEESMREATWKEVMHKAKLKVRRVPMNLYYDLGGQGQRSQFLGQAGVDEYAYQVLIIEDLDDGRVHTFEDNEPQPQSYEGLMMAGIREILPIHQISKIFYADTGKILNISTDGETNNPVLLLKRDLNALPPRRMMERDGVEEEEEPTEHEEPEDEEQAQLDAQLNGAGGPTSASFNSLHEDFIPEEWRLPPGLDPEWIAFEVYNEDSSSDSESEAEITQAPTTDSPVERMAKLSIKDDRHNSSLSPSPSPSTRKNLSRRPPAAPETTTVSNPLFENIRTSLSLLETLLRLTSLQQFQQQSHLSISDELLNFFLEESSSTGAGGDEQHRQRLRSEARRRVGWDPYDESPVKRRGEDYQYGWMPGSPSGYPGEGGDELYSPGGGSPGLRLRSRENTPETVAQQQQRASTGVKSERRQPSGLRGVTPAYNDDYDSGFREASSPLARKSGSVSKDKKGAGSGTAE